MTSLAVFGWFFYAIGAWYVGLIPVFVGLIVILISSKSYRQQSRSNTQRQQYSIYAAWLAMLVGFTGIATFFSDSTVQIGLRILSINIIFWMASYMFSYNDGKYMAQTGYYAGIIYILRQLSYSVDRYGLRGGISMLWVLTLAIVGFIVGVLGHWRQIESYLWYKLFLLSGGAICIAIGSYVVDIYTVLLIDSMLIFALSIGLYIIVNYHIPSSQEIKKISVRRILAGEKINNNKHIPHQDIIRTRLYHFVKEMPLWTRYSIEAVNCRLVIITIGLYLDNISTTVVQWHQWVYWIIIGLFIATALMLKRIDFSSVMQKVTLFAVINYAIYLTLYTLFDGAIGAIAGWGIVWNIMSSILLFYAPSSFLADILKKQDYRYWIVMTVLALCINIYLLGLTGLAGQLIFSISFVYLGLQGILLYYGLLHVQQVE